MKIERKETATTSENRLSCNRSFFVLGMYCSIPLKLTQNTSIAKPIFKYFSSTNNTVSFVQAFQQQEHLRELQNKLYRIDEIRKKVCSISKYTTDTEIATFEEYQSILDNISKSCALFERNVVYCLVYYVGLANSCALEQYR